LLSYNYQKFDASVAEGRRYATGSFAKQYATSMRDLKANAVKEKAVVQAKVSAAGVVSATGDRVVLLLYVDQYRQNTNIDGQKVDQNRVLMTMVPAAGDWKVSKVVAF
jgi:Mce-associated membrane protein